MQMFCVILRRGKVPLVEFGCEVIPRQPVFVKASAALQHHAEGREDEHHCVSGHLSLDRLNMIVQ